MTPRKRDIEVSLLPFIILVVLFWGEPDLLDALIHSLICQ